MDRNRWYEHWLHKANKLERSGDMKGAVAALDKAETKTGDSDELYHLRLWRDRLKDVLAKQAEAAP